MDLALFALRAVVGLLMMGHGAQKLFGSFGGHGLAGTGQFFEALGLRPGRRNATAAGVGEFGGGLLLVLGLLTPLGAAALIGVMVVAPERRSPAYLQNLVESEIQKWAGPIKAAGVSVD